MRTALLYSLLFLASCTKSPDKELAYTWQPLQGREEICPGGELVRRPAYRVKVPVTWKRDPEHLNDIVEDTTKPNATFLIDENVIVHFHTFPTDRLEQRVPAEMQVKEWESQSVAKRVEKVQRAGFVGLFYEGVNGTLAWSLQLDPELYQTLTLLATTHNEQQFFRQLRADYTIKVTGPKNLIAEHIDEIHLFVNSLELVQKIPDRA